MLNSYFIKQQIIKDDSITSLFLYFVGFIDYTLYHCCLAEDCNVLKRFIA